MNRRGYHNEPYSDENWIVRYPIPPFTLFVASFYGETSCRTQ
jgi:hypothetical protein